MSNKKIKILIAESQDFSQDVIANLKQYADVYIKKVSQDNLKQTLDNYDVFWFRLGFQINKQILSEQTRCKILATPVTGIDHIDEKLCAKYGIKIVCLRGEREFLKEVRATAEMTIGLAMSVMRQIPRATQSVQSGIWNRDLFRGNELHKKVMGIIGFGRLGKIVAEYALAFGMRVLAVEPRNEAKEDVKNVEFVDLETLAAKSDIISLHVNYTITTHHLIGEEFFRACKTSAFFINTSRGGIVDENALLNALKGKWIQGAALDVLQNEPSLSQASPLIAYAREYNNLIIVPHIGGNTYESFEKTEHFIANKILNIIQSDY